MVTRLALVLLLAQTSACGYRFVAPGSTLPEGLRAVHVPMFTNATAEPGAEVLFTQALRESLLRAGRLADAPAEGTLEGSVQAVNSAPFVGGAGRLPTYRLNALVLLTLKRGSRIVTSMQLAGAEDFPAGADVLWAESNRAAALRRLAEALMKEGLDRLSAIAIVAGP